MKIVSISRSAARNHGLLRRLDGRSVHAAVPDAFIERVLAVAHRTPRHTDLLLTQRAERLPGSSSGVPCRPTSGWA